MRIRNVVSFVVLTVITVGAVGYLASMGIRLRPPSDRTRLSMQLTDVNNLVVGSRVLLRGVTVGEVSAISADSAAASIDFFVDNRYRIPVDTDIRIENLSALGETYIGLVPRTGGGPALVDGQHIAAERVISPPSISEFATSVVRVLNQLEPSALRRIVAEADTAMPDPAATLPNLATASALLRDGAVNMNGKARELLTNFQTLLRNADWVGPALIDIAEPAPRVALGLQDVTNTLGRTMPMGAPQIFYDFHHFFDRLQNLLDTRGGDLKVLGDAMRSRLNAIAGSLMNFDTGQMLSNVLDAVPEDGAITLRVAIPDEK